MKLAFYAKSALYNLRYSKLRSLLTILGILVGTASVVALISSGQLATEQALQQFQALGTNLLSVSLNLSDNDSGDSSDRIKADTVFFMKTSIPNINEVAPYTTSYMQVIYNNINFGSSVIGTTQALNGLIGIHMKQGRFISDLDENQFFCVIGSNVYKRLHTLDPIGQRIQLGDTIFTIIGVTAPWAENSFFSQDVNESIFIPLETTDIVSSRSSINDVVMRIKEDADIDAVKNDIYKYLSETAPAYNLTFRSSKEIIMHMSAQQEIFTLLLGLIGSISLFVGGIGIMNIMLVSVVERRHEIGLRIAIGAQPKDIQWMFLMEAIMMAIMGGGLGVILGVACTYIIANIAGWHFIFFITPALVGFFVSVAVCVFFGFYPAYKASQLNPIDALYSG